MTEKNTESTLLLRESGRGCDTHPEPTRGTKRADHRPLRRTGARARRGGAGRRRTGDRPDRSGSRLLGRGRLEASPEGRSTPNGVDMAVPGDLGGDILDRGNRCVLRLRRLAKPVVRQHQWGRGGCRLGRLALATDLRIASEAARFGVVYSPASAFDPTPAPRPCCVSWWERRRRSSSSSSAIASTLPKRFAWES